jgi:hypothetical protein
MLNLAYMVLDKVAALPCRDSSLVNETGHFAVTRQFGVGQVFCRLYF